MAKDSPKHQQFPERSWRSFRRNWWRTSGEVWKEIFELLLLGKSSEAFSTKTPPQISPSNFTTRFWVVAGPIIHGQRLPRVFRSDAVAPWPLNDERIQYYVPENAVFIGIPLPLGTKLLHTVFYVWGNYFR